MKLARLALALLLLAAAGTACTADATGPRADDCPVTGGGVGTC